jgi:hypothetical protein
MKNYRSPFVAMFADRDRNMFPAMSLFALLVRFTALPNSVFKPT